MQSSQRSALPKLAGCHSGGADPSCVRQVAFIEELQRRLAPQEDALRFKHAHLSRSSPDLARADLDADLDGVLPEHRAPFELRALEVALDVVCTTILITITIIM